MGFFRADAQQWEESQRQEEIARAQNQEVEWEKQRRAREQEIRERPAKELEAYYNKQKEKKLDVVFFRIMLKMLPLYYMS